MSTPRAAAVYARISSDPTGSAHGVTRQVEDCRKTAETLGWPVADEYVDNDVSAYKGARRPAYERMLADLEAGHIDGVIVWHIDRLTRRPIELEQFVQVLDAAKVTAVRFVTGDADLGSGDGLLMARIMAAVANKESADKSRRIKRLKEQHAAEGRPSGSGTRPFGYQQDGMTVIDGEAQILRDVVARFLAGESLTSVTKSLQADGVATVAGKPWRTQTVRGMVTNPRYAGLRAHLGTVVGPALWPAIITEDEHRRVLALLASKKTTGRRAPQRYLLSGLLRCGRCGTRLYSAARQEGARAGHRANGKQRYETKTTRRYVCSSSPDHGGCGRLTIVADTLEEFLTDAVLYRLDSPELTDMLAGRNAEDETTRELAGVIEQTGVQLRELADAYAARQITMTEWLHARRSIEDEQATAQRRLAARTRHDALIGLPGNGSSLRASWDTLNLSRQHAIIAAVIDHAIIGPGTPGRKPFDPDRVSVTWRV